MNITQAGSIGGFNDQGECGCAHPAVHLFPLVPWTSGCRVLRIGGLWGSRETHPGLGERSLFTHPSKMVYNGPWEGAEVAWVCTRLFWETP